MSRSDADRSTRATEVLAVILLAIATVGSAWCAYQSNRWNGEQSDLAQQSTDLRIEATRQFAFGSQIVAYDSNIAASYAEAYLDGNTELMEFYRNVLSRPDFVPILDEWEKEAADPETKLGSLLTDEEYLGKQLAGYQDTMNRSDAVAAEGRTAGRTADQYIVLTLLLAGALFFAGVMSSFSSSTVRLFLLLLSAVLIAVTAGQVVSLPIAQF